MKRLFFIIFTLLLMILSVGIMSATAEERQVNIESSVEQNNAINPYKLEEMRSTPRILSITCEEKGAKIVWTKISSAVQYRVYAKGEDEYSWRVVCDTEDTFALDGKVENNKVYSYTVRALDKKGDVCIGYDTLSSSIHYYNAPKLISADTTFGAINISWAKLDGVNVYRLYRKAKIDSDYMVVADTSGLSYLDTNIENDISYIYTVSALNDKGEEISSYDHKGLDAQYLQSPKLISADVTNEGVKVSWEKVSSANKYMLIYKRKTDNKWIDIGITDKTYFVDTKVNSNEEYTYSVRCISDDEKSYTSLFDTQGKTARFIGVPHINEINQVKDGIYLSWNKVNGADKYRVYYKRIDDSEYTTDDTLITDKTSFVLKKIEPGYSYTLTVQSLDKNNSSISGYEEGKSIKYLKTPEFTRAKEEDGTIYLEWDAVESAYAYRVFYKETDDEHYFPLIDTKETSYSFSPDKEEYTYQFSIRCIDEDEDFTSAFVDGPVITTYLLNLTEAEPDENYSTCCINLSDEDRDLAERICMGEASVLGYEGMALVAQCVRDSFLRGGYTNIADVLRDFKYDGSTATPGNDEAKAAVHYIFDEGGAAVQHRILVFYASDLCHSAFHESQHYICSCGAVRFFDYWGA